MRPVAAIQRIVCEVFDISLEDMLGPCRQRKYARPRQVAIYIARNMTCSSTTDIGNRFNRDHSTVIHASRIVPTWGCYDPEFEWLAAIAIWRCAFAIPVPWTRDPVRLERLELELEEAALRHQEAYPSGSRIPTEKCWTHPARANQAQGIGQAERCGEVAL